MPEGSISGSSRLGLRPAQVRRLPDQLEIKFGPIEALGRFILRADRILRDNGIKLSICTDFEEFIETNRQKRDRGWYGPLPCFSSKYSRLDQQNAFWLKGVNSAGGTVLAHAIRLYLWPRSTLKAEVESAHLMYESVPEGVRGEATAPTAAIMSGRVCMMGALWLDPDYRGSRLASTISPLTRALALSRWYQDFCFSIVSKEGIDKGRAALYGWPATNVEYAIKFWNFPDYAGPQPHGYLCFATRQEIEDVVIGTIQPMTTAVRETEPHMLPIGAAAE